MKNLQKRQTRNKLPPIAQAVNFVPKRIGFHEEAQRSSVGISPSKKKVPLIQQTHQSNAISVNMQRRLMKTTHMSFKTQIPDDVATQETQASSGIIPIQDVYIGSPNIQAGRVSRQMHRRNISKVLYPPKIVIYDVPKKTCSSGEVTQENSHELQQNLGVSPPSRRRYLSCATSPVKGVVNYDSSSSRNSRRTMVANPKSPTDIMMDRWMSAIRTIPEVDRQDVYAAAATQDSETMRQVEPEYTQTSYKRILQIEQSGKQNNYLQVKKNHEDQQGHHLPAPESAQGVQINIKSRSYGIQRIFYLHEQKQYKRETLFVACHIFDRYIAASGLNFDPKEVITLATISVLMSAKLEQPISPNFNRMISLLTAQEQQIVTKPKLIDLEEKILTKFGFDFNFGSPMQAFERYLRILNYDQNDRMQDLCYQICKYQLTEPHFLNYDDSVVAAAATLLSINIYERDSEKRGISQKQFFQQAMIVNSQNKASGLLQFNTEIWNNESIHRVAGHSIADIRDCLYHLAVFVAFNMQPNCLADFDIESIKFVQPYTGYSKVSML